jgi:hypothetical protein
MGIDGEELVKKLADDPGSFPEIAASFHFSMLGFLAAFLAISVAITQTIAFQEYRKYGNLRVQLWLISLTMAELTIGFVLAMMMVTTVNGNTLIVLNIYAIAVCLLMLVISLSPIIFMLLKVASSSDEEQGP